MKQLSLILIALNLASCTLVGGGGSITPEQQAARNKKVQVAVAEIVDPLFATIESACGYRKAYSEWPVLNSQEDSSESFEIVSINAEEEQLETVFKFRKLSYLLDVKILNKNGENTGKECYVYINGVNANGDSLFKSEGTYVLGESMISKDEKVAYARTFMLFNTFANFAAQSEQSSEKQINEKSSAGAEFLGVIGGAVLKVSICILLNVEPGNCR